jgi:hypothetical protein
LVASSNSFLLPDNAWINVPLNNVPYSGTFYVMVNWTATTGNTNGLGYDTNGPYATANLGRHIISGNWYFYPDNPGVFLIRANATSLETKSVKYGTNVTKPVVLTNGTISGLHERFNESSRSPSISKQ